MRSNCSTGYVIDGLSVSFVQRNGVARKGLSREAWRHRHGEGARQLLGGQPSGSMENSPRASSEVDLPSPLLVRIRIGLKFLLGFSVNGVRLSLMGRYVELVNTICAWSRTRGIG